MELTNYKKTDKLREMNPETLEEILKTKFKYFLSNLLSLSEDKEEGLNNAIKAIKTHCIGTTLSEVKKAFEMYANSELDIIPISNHIDYILVGKIFNEFKKLRTRPKEKKQLPEATISEEEKELIVYSGVVNCFDSYFQYKIIDDGYYWVGSYLGKKGLIKFTPEERKSMMEQAQRNVKKNALNESYSEYKKLISQIERKKNSKVEVEFIYIGLAKYFDKLIAEGKHIKDLI